MTQEQTEGLGLIGSATAKAHGYLKRHPWLRRRVISVFNIARRFVDTLGRADRSRLAGYVDPHQWVEDWNADTSKPGGVITDVMTAEHVVSEPPRGVHGKIEPEFIRLASVEIPQPFVIEIPDGHALGENGAVATPDGQVIERLSRPVGSLLGHLLGGQVDNMSPHILQGDWDRRPKRVGRAAVLSTYVGRGYFHWLFDVLPRLSLLEAAGVSIDSLDAVIIPSYFARYQIETMARFGIGRDRVVSSFSHRHVVADSLVAPSLPRETGLIPRWVCDFLRETYQPTRPAGVDPISRISIVRRSTDHGLLGNEARLNQRLDDLGFVPVAMEDYSLEEKAWLLQHADAIVSPSGGGLANVVFCEPGTVVVELRVQPYPVMEAWDIASRMDLRFYDVLPDGYERSTTMDALT
ncbi:MAG: glycosyltransferase family 61 protein, partial [Acidimicrobiia bacterium]